MSCSISIRSEVIYNMDVDEKYMRLAIDEPKHAEIIAKIPSGGISVYHKKDSDSVDNQREQDETTLSHAELLAIKEANEYIGSWRLEDCTLYVTLEPCPMCAGAIVQSRIPRIVYGANDPKAGCTGTLMNLCNEKRFNHQSNVTS